MKQALVPNFVGKRWLKISLRSLHLVGVAGVFASAFMNIALPHYWLLLILSGLGLLLLESLSNILWFIQIRAIVMYLKFILLTILYYYPAYAWYCMVSMILLSGAISHAPSNIRYFSFIHLKKIQSVNDIKG